MLHHLDMAVFAEVEKRFSTALSSGRLDSDLGCWRSRHPDLGRFANIEELIQFCRHSDPCDQAKDRVVSALRREAVSGPDGTAALVLIWLFRPTLISLARTGREHLEVEDLDAELLAGFWEIVATDGEVGKLCGRLKNGARHRAQRAARKEAIYKRGAAPYGTGEDSAATLDAESPWPLLAQAREKGVVSALDLEIIVRTRFEGFSLKEVACQLKMNHQVAGRRRKAAENHLRVWLSR